MSLSPGVFYSAHPVGLNAIQVDFYRSNAWIGFLHVDTIENLDSELSFLGTFNYLLAG